MTQPTASDPLEELRGLFINRSVRMLALALIFYLILASSIAFTFIYVVDGQNHDQNVVTSRIASDNLATCQSSNVARDADRTLFTHIIDQSVPASQRSADLALVVSSFPDRNCSATQKS